MVALKRLLVVFSVKFASLIYPVVVLFNSVVVIPVILVVVFGLFSE